MLYQQEENNEIKFQQQNFVLYFLEKSAVSITNEWRKRKKLVISIASSMRVIEIIQNF